MSRHRSKSSSTTSFNCTLCTSGSSYRHRYNSSPSRGNVIRPRDTFRDNARYVTLCQIRYGSRNGNSGCNGRYPRPQLFRSLARVMNQTTSGKIFTLCLVRLNRYEFCGQTKDARRNGRPRPRCDTQATCYGNNNGPYGVTHACATNGKSNGYLRQ